MVEIKIKDIDLAENLEQKAPIDTSEKRSELPDDSGEKKNKCELPDDSGENFEESEFLSTYKERLDRTPKEGERGIWTGERGESPYIPSDQEMKDILDQYGLDEIVYNDAVPDFSGCSESTVEIDNMTEQRGGKGGNFEQCDQKCAEQWNTEARDGKTDWTARDVADWRVKNKYSWHERNDMKTCDLIPTKVNDYFGHLGGVSECKKCTGVKDGGFDE